jgi:hypothetical protein
LLFRLCLAIGCPHPDYLETILTHRQLGEWQTFAEIEPWGTPADDYRAALQTWGSVMPHSKKTLDPTSFLPQWGGKDPLTPKEYKERAQKAYIKAAGSKGSKGNHV